MRTTCQFKNPDEMEVNISVTMTLREWRLLLRQMDDPKGHLAHPMCEMRREVTDVIRKVDSSFSAASPESD